MTNKNKARFTLRLPNELLEKINDKAESLGLSKNALILTLINQDLNKSS